MNLQPWKASGLLTSTRTVGEVGFNKNSDILDIWIRVNGKPAWFGVPVANLTKFLSGDDKTTVLWAESDGNAEGEVVSDEQTDSHADFFVRNKVQILEEWRSTDGDIESVPIKVRSMPDRLRHYASLLTDAPTEWTENGPPTVAAIAFGLEMLADEMEEEQ